MRFDLDMRRFWEVNRDERVPASIDLPGDWICVEMGLDFARYYSEFDYQQEMRLRCGERSMRELSLPIKPAVDFGVVMDASIYGGAVNYESNATPTLAPVVDDPSEIPALVERMERINPLEKGLVPRYLEWREKLWTRYGVRAAHGTGIKGAATMLGQLCGITNFLTWILTDPDEVKLLVDCWLRTSLRYLHAIRRETGCADVLDRFSFQSDVAGMLSPALYREFLLDAEHRIYQEFATEKGAIRYYHADSHMLHQLGALGEIGVNQVNIDPYITPAQILAVLPDAVIHGQIPPTHTLLYGSPEDVVACVRRDIAEAGAGEHLIVTTAGSINPGTTYENLRAMCYAVEKYGYYRN